MKREEIFNKIVNGLYSCKDEYGEGLNVHFNAEQLKDFANTITAFFPDNLEYKLTLLETELFDNIPDKEEMLFNLFRFNQSRHFKNHSQNIRIKKRISFNIRFAIKNKLFLFLYSRNEVSLDSDSRFTYFVIFDKC